MDEDSDEEPEGLDDLDEEWTSPTSKRRFDISNPFETFRFHEKSFVVLIPALSCTVPCSSACLK